MPREAVGGGQAAEEVRKAEIRPADTRPCVSERTRALRADADPCTASGRPGARFVSGGGASQVGAASWWGFRGGSGPPVSGWGDDQGRGCSLPD